MSSSARANLIAVAPNGPQPLATRDRVAEAAAPAADPTLPAKLPSQNVQDAALQAEARDLFASLTPKRRAVTVSYTLRIRLDQDSSLQRICRERGIKDVAPLVRDAIDALIAHADKSALAPADC